LRSAFIDGLGSGLQDDASNYGIAEILIEHCVEAGRGSEQCMVIRRSEIEDASEKSFLHGEVILQTSCSYDKNHLKNHFFLLLVDFVSILYELVVHFTGLHNHH
jgi:hypothetical protein